MYVFSEKPNAKIEERQNRVEMEWEYRYMRIIDSEDWLKLFFFLGDFKYHCINLVKHIVLRLGPVEELTNIDHRFHTSKPGQKVYLKDNIVIRIAKMKFANLRYDTEGFKAMNQEMLSNNCVNNLFLMFLQQRTMRMRVPVTCMVDYMGHRAFCQADTTCAGSATMLYGSTPDRQFKYNETVDLMLGKVGKHLNLKSYHVITTQRLRIPVPLSLYVQVHYAKMEKYDEIRKILDDQSYLYTETEKKPQREDHYIFNLWRLWPIYVEKNLERNKGFLRPQYVLNWNRPLSNAVFQNIGDRVDEQGELELADACKTLKEDRIGELSKRLDDSQIILIDSYGISTVFHEYGINLRFMGALAEKSRMNHVKSILEVEMITQTLKKVYFCNTDYDTSIMKQALIDFLNLVFMATKEGEQFFIEIIYPDIREYYDYQLQDYPPRVPGGGLLHAICYHFGVEIKILDYPFFVEPQERMIFNSMNVGEFVGHAVTFSLDTVELRTLVEDYKSKKKSLPKECLKNLEMLIAMNRGLNHAKTFTKGSHPEAVYYSEMAELHMNNQEYELAREAAAKALEMIPEKHADAVKPLCVLIKYESIKGRRGKSLQHYDQTLSAIAFHLGGNHPLEISAYNVIGFEFLRHNQPEKCEKILKKSFEVCSQTLGYLHITCSDILVQLSTLPLPPSVRLGFLLQCLSILEGLKVEEALLKIISLRIAEIYQEIGDSKGMLLYARRANNRRMQIVAADKLLKYEDVIVLCSIYPESLEEAQFLIEKCFNAYVKLLDRTRTNYLFKIFVAVEGVLETDKKQVYEKFRAIMLEDHKSVSLMIEEACNIILQNGKAITQSPGLYTEIDNVVMRMKDNRLKKMFDSYLMLLAVIGRERATSILDNNSKFLQQQKSSAKKSQYGSH